MAIHSNLKSIYRRILIDGWRVDECFRWDNGVYTISLCAPAYSLILSSGEDLVLNEVEYTDFDLEPIR